MHVMRFILSLVTIGLIPHGSSRLIAVELKPLLAIPDRMILADDFSKPHPLDKSHWKPKQGTRWAIENGVLRGRESSAEFQSLRADHFGYEPRISVPATPHEFIAEFSIRFGAGKETDIVPFVEFGHHVCRVRFSREGAALLAEHESVKLAEARDFIWQPGKWYRMLAEMKSGRFVLQINDGPSLFAEHASFKKPVETGGNGLGVAGPRHALVELDDVTIWSIKPHEQPTWNRRKSEFPKFEIINVR